MSRLLAALALGVTALLAMGSAQTRAPLTREQALANIGKPDVETRRETQLHGLPGDRERS